MIHNCTISTRDNYNNDEFINTQYLESTSVRESLNQRNFNKKNEQREVQIIDEFGCSIYPQILPNVHYSKNLEASLESQAFSLDFDKVNLNHNKLKLII